MVALKRNDFSKRTLSRQALDFTQCSQSTKYLFALGADLAVIHSPSSLFEIAEQAPQFEDLMICCMTREAVTTGVKKTACIQGTCSHVFPCFLDGGMS